MPITKKQPAAMINISGPSPASVAAVRAAVLAILSAPHADEETKRTALAAFQSVCEVKSTSISNCTFTNA